MAIYEAEPGENLENPMVTVTPEPGDEMTERVDIVFKLSAAPPERWVASIVSCGDSSRDESIFGCVTDLSTALYRNPEELIRAAKQVVHKYQEMQAL